MKNLRRSFNAFLDPVRLGMQACLPGNCYSSSSTLSSVAAPYLRCICCYTAAGPNRAAALDVIRQLLEASSPSDKAINALGRDQLTPLQLAIKRGSTEVPLNLMYAGMWAVLMLPAAMVSSGVAGEFDSTDRTSQPHACP